MDIGDTQRAARKICPVHLSTLIIQHGNIMMMMTTMMSDDDDGGGGADNISRCDDDRAV